MGMKLQYNLENIGNIDKASIIIKPLTIIAGENSSGKTFVTKSLYTILSYIKKDYFLREILDSYTLLEKKIFKNIDKKYETNFFDNSNIIVDIIYELTVSSYSEQKEILERHKEVFLEFKEKVLKYFEGQTIPSDTIQLLEDFLYITSNYDVVFEKNMLKKIEIAFKKNFQITNLQNLIKDSNGKDITLTIKNICEVIINEKFDLKLDTNQNMINQLDNVVFFDSPVYIKIRKALEKKVLPQLDYDGRQDNDKYLKGYPEYINDLYKNLDLEYIDTPDFDTISQEIQQIIKGKLDVSPSGDINYTDNQNNTIPLSLTAMGISNIGLIDLLLRNNVINKGSFLIMDEPEVHLHPEWQVILAKLLYKISKSGANIIIATHSLDFLKAFENILKEENEVAENIISINKMPYNKEFSEKTELEKVGIVLDDLSRPFYNLYMQDI